MQQISAIIPARDEEENIEGVVRSVAAQAEIAEIIVVDDQSRDGTAAILSRLAAEVRGLRVLQAGQLPAGWVGKNHALWLGVQAAKQDWLLFTDADTRHLAGATQRALEDAQRYGAALVSYSPEQIMESAAERALVPFVYCRMARKFDFAAVNDTSKPDAAANGQFILVRREAYEKAGGHRAIAGVVLEDVALARRVKEAGFRLHFASGEGIARTRMYRSFGAMWQGWTKNLYLLLGGTLAKSAREIMATFPWAFVILILAAIFHRGGWGEWLLTAGAAALVAGHSWYARELSANRYSARFIVYYGVAAPLYAAAVAASSWKYQRGKVLWKGREYPASES